MEFEFDKEIDSLLRQAARSETASVDSKFQTPDSRLSHLDADQISAFAENALPEKSKLRLTAHFADCDRCRKILSNVILLNSETAEKASDAPNIAKLQTIAPWYRRLFAVPNLAYALGALVLIFGGLLAVTFLKSVSPKSSEEISQMRETPTTTDSATNSAAAPPALTESNRAAMSNLSLMSSNASAANSAARAASPNAPAANVPTKAVSPNSNAAAISNGQTIAGDQKAKNELPQDADKDAPKTNLKIENQTTDVIAAAGAARLAEQKKQSSEDENRARKNDDKEIALSDAAPPAAKPVQPSSVTATRRAAAPESAMAKKAQNKEADKTETRFVGGKTFRRGDGGVWYDSSYGGQSATNVRRGTSEYQKLDFGLRSIADNLDGTIVVVWKSKAYRIQ